MLSIFFFWDRPSVSRERRSTCRYTPVRNQVFVGWWNGPDFQTITGVMRDVSLGGASIVFDGPPPDDELVWISLYKIPPTDWVEASIVRADKVKGGLFARRQTQIRVKFSADCSYDLIKSGIEVQGRIRSQ